MGIGAFPVAHALAVLRMGPVERVVAATGHAPGDVLAELDRLRVAGVVVLMERRGLWRLTADGMRHHAGLLAADVPPPARAALSGVHRAFVPLNQRFKDLCTRWQLRGGAANDHGDPGYDRDVVAELGALHREAEAVVGDLAAVRDRFARYGTRLAGALDRVESGERSAFTGVGVESYHDVWMELHADLLLSTGSTREAEEALEHASGSAS
ncbi:hypothetical protein [Saccharothrix syringae]|uniref:MarR family transcriptional regulator n=1 Tax=Saccharothrix syringae TaxID=103733 RepID=A0A5Q0H4K5_SACSY|nr:hypothetical protein [Saccharothrix syringae]QFZ20672.1 MarR family transcriptional regulator [Saccharothrix syringae]